MGAQGAVVGLSQQVSPVRAGRDEGGPTPCLHPCPVPAFQAGLTSPPPSHAPGTRSTTQAGRVKGKGPGKKSCTC